LEQACSINKAVIGLNHEGYRGLMAATDIAPGEVVLQIPLCNMLQIPRQLTQPDMQLAAMAAFTTWQQQHWQLPDHLLSFFEDTEVVWESKLVAWLLYLKAAAPEGSLWHSYIHSLPAAADAITFCSYSEQQAEQLQFSTWKVGLVRAFLCANQAAEFCFVAVIVTVSAQQVWLCFACRPAFSPECLQNTMFFGKVPTGKVRSDFAVSCKLMLWMPRCDTHCDLCSPAEPCRKATAVAADGAAAVPSSSRTAGLPITHCLL
jgi:hypothetical protein